MSVFPSVLETHTFSYLKVLQTHYSLKVPHVCSTYLRNPSRNPSHQPLGSREQSPEARQPTPVPEASEHPTPDLAQRLLPDSPDLPQMPLPPFPRNPDFGQPEGTPFEEAPNLTVALILITEELRHRDRSAHAPKLAKAK